MDECFVLIEFNDAPKEATFVPYFLPTFATTLPTTSNPNVEPPAVAMMGVEKIE